MTVLRTIGVQVTSGTEDVGKQSVHAEIDEVYVRHIVPKDTDTDTKSNDE